MNTGKVLLGVLAGVAAGALVGVLLAPQKGSVTRNKMLEKGDGYLEDLKDRFNSFLEELKTDAGVVKQKTGDFLDNGAAKVEQFKVK